MSPTDQRGSYQEDAIHRRADGTYSAASRDGSGRNLEKLSAERDLEIEVMKGIARGKFEKEWEENGDGGS